jgi:hypothetical protein
MTNQHWMHPLDSWFALPTDHHMPVHIIAAAARLCVLLWYSRCTSEAEAVTSSSC